MSKTYNNMSIITEDKRTQLYILLITRWVQNIATIWVLWLGRPKSIINKLDIKCSSSNSLWSTFQCQNWQWSIIPPNHHSSFNKKTYLKNILDKISTITCDKPNVGVCIISFWNKFHVSYLRKGIQELLILVIKNITVVV